MRFELPELDPTTAERQNPSHTLEVASEETGLRIVFDEDGSGAEHDLLIEHWRSGWALLLHAFGGAPIVVVEILSDRLEVRDEVGRVLLSIPIAAPQQPTRSS
jgi:hypothetical protein